MNFSRLAPSPPFPRFPAPPPPPGTPRCLCPSSGDRCWGQGGAQPASSRILAPKSCIQSRSCLQERVFVHGQVSPLGRKTSAFPKKVIPGQSCSSGTAGGKGLVSGLVCWGGNGYQALFRRAECNLLRYDFCDISRTYLLVHDGGTSRQVLLVVFIFHAILYN